MKHLKIRNIGPLKDVDMDLKRINVIIGPQGSGKSCILKIACFCTWLEKQIALEGSCDDFESDWITAGLVKFHKLDDFIRGDSFIEYESDLMRFSYSWASDVFDFHWKDDKWSYKRTKICYIPAERNMMAVIPNWFEVAFPNNNIRNFLTDWEHIRKSVADLPILDLGVAYHYNTDTGGDEVRIGGDETKTFKFANASSGFQSVIPICLFVRHFFKDQFIKETHESVETVSENIDILSRLYSRYKERIEAEENKGEPDSGHGGPESFRINGRYLPFLSKSDADECKRIYSNFTTVDHCDLFLEEPESNIFPATQHELLHWIVGMSGGERKHSLFISTHSPYVMTSLNNLIEAGNVIMEDGDKRDAVGSVIPKERILSYEEVGAYMVDGGSVNDIMDTDNRLVSAESLDAASDIISNEFNRLLDL